MEHSVVQFGHTPIPYRIRRSARRTTVAVQVAAGEEVLLTAPAGVSVRRLDAIVYRKAPWILDRLRAVQQVAARLPGREFISGETFLYLGRHYRLGVREVEALPGPAKLSGGWLRVEVSPGLYSGERAAAVRQRLMVWYKTRAGTLLPARAQFWQCRLDAPLRQVLIREPRQRWGSCSPHGVLRFNWRIVQAPRRLVDYVVVHELAHLLHPNHTPAYWALVGRVLPDYEQRKEALRRLGRRLLW